LRLFSFGGYGLALAALALVVFGAIECPLPPQQPIFTSTKSLMTSYLKKKYAIHIVKLKFYPVGKYLLFRLKQSLLFLRIKKIQAC